MSEFTKEEIKSFTKNIKKLKHENYKKEKFSQVYINEIPTSYLISSYGRLYSTNFHGKKNNVTQIKTRSDSYGYEVANIWVEGKMYTVKIHRLVAYAFIPNKKNKQQVNHKNGNKFYNRYWNLEWVTPKENINHAYKTGLKIPLKGEEVYCSKYTEKDIINICELLLQNKSFSYIMKELGVPRYMIHYVLHKKRWKYLVSEYNFDDYCYGKDVSTIKNICELLESNKYTQAEIAKITNSNVKLVNAILTGHSYKTISKNYDLTKFTKYRKKYNKKS